MNLAQLIHKRPSRQRPIQGRLQRAIISLLQQHSTPLEAVWIAEQTSKPLNSICVALANLVEKGAVKRMGIRNSYRYTI